MNGLFAYVLGRVMWVWDQLDGVRGVLRSLVRIG